MPNTAAALIDLVQKLEPRVRKHWPEVLAALGVLIKYLTDHPDLPIKVRDVLVSLVRQVVENLLPRGPAAKIQGSLETVQSVARRAKESGQTLDADAFIRRARAIGLGLELAEGQQGSVKKAALSGLRQQTDALLAELISAVTGSVALS